MPSSYDRRTNPGMSAFITPMLTTGMVNPVLPSVRWMSGPESLASFVSKSVFPRTLAVPANMIGFTMNSLRFHSIAELLHVKRARLQSCRPIEYILKAHDFNRVTRLSAFLKGTTLVVPPEATLSTGLLAPAVRDFAHLRALGCFLPQSQRSLS